MSSWSAINARKAPIPSIKIKLPATPSKPVVLHLKPSVLKSIASNLSLPSSSSIKKGLPTQEPITFKNQNLSIKSNDVPSSPIMMSSPLPFEEDHDTNTSTVKKKASKNTKRSAKRKGTGGVGLLSSPAPEATASPGPDSTHANTPTATVIAPVSAPKVTVKSNLSSNVNAQIRVLDRSGKPCRKWKKAKVNIKSFTGYQFNVNVWNGGTVDIKDNEPKKENGTNGINGNQTNKKNDSIKDDIVKKENNFKNNDKIGIDSIIGTIS